MPTDYTLDDDGATEVVDLQPRRKALEPILLEPIVKSKASGRVQAMIDAGDAHRREFIILRKANQPAVRIALPHLQVYKAIWALWSANRVAGLADAGVAPADIKRHLLAQGVPLAPTSITSAVRSLTRGGVLRVTDTHVGYQHRRTRYYPTEQGVQAFALAEVLGDHASVQIGRTASAWKNRSDAEPGSLFDYATLIRGGSDLDPAESA